jgi:hypothetical protein
MNAANWHEVACQPDDQKVESSLRRAELGALFGALHFWHGARILFRPARYGQFTMPGQQGQGLIRIWMMMVICLEIDCRVAVSRTHFQPHRGCILRIVLVFGQVIVVVAAQLCVNGAMSSVSARSRPEKGCQREDDLQSDQKN